MRGGNRVPTALTRMVKGYWSANANPLTAQHPILLHLFRGAMWTDAARRMEAFDTLMAADFSQQRLNRMKFPFIGDLYSWAKDGDQEAAQYLMQLVLKNFDMETIRECAKDFYPDLLKVLPPDKKEPEPPIDLVPEPVTVGPYE